MGADEGDVYMLRPDEDVTDDDETWVSPEPASEVILEEVAAAVDADPDDFEALDAYVDLEDLAELFAEETDEDESLTFELEGHEVTVSRNGDVDVDLDD
jgi:hypothetical protein